MNNSKRFAIIVFFISFSLLCYAHSGRTDKYGGHNNRKTGGYHYHNSGKVHNANNPYHDHTKCGICIKTPKINIVSKEYNQSDIYFIQSSLSQLGYKVTIDGIWGDNTKKLLKRFQTENGITPTGNIDKETKLKIIDTLKLQLNK